MALPWRDESVLKELLVEREMTLKEAAEELGCHWATVLKWKQRHGVLSPNDKYSMNSEHPWQDEDTLRHLYHEKGMNAEEIAGELGCSQSVVYKWMQKHDIERRSLAEARAISNNYTHNPKPHINTRGYEVFRNEHRGEQDTFYHHRLLAVAKYGFDALKDKHVHHKNRIQWDNRPDNIELMDASEHQTHHLVNDRWG